MFARVALPHLDQFAVWCVPEPAVALVPPATRRFYRDGYEYEPTIEGLPRSLDPGSVPPGRRTCPHKLPRGR